MHYSFFIQLLHNKNFTGYVHIEKTNLKSDWNLFCLAGESTSAATLKFCVETQREAELVTLRPVLNDSKLSG